MSGSADFQVGSKENDDTAAAFKEAANWAEIDTLAGAGEGFAVSEGKMDQQGISKQATRCRCFDYGGLFLLLEFKK